MNIKHRFLSFIIILITFTLSAQESAVSHSFYFIGNTGNFPEDKNWESFRSFIKGTKEDFTLIHLGDLANNKDPEKHKAAIDKLSKTLEGIPNGKIYFTPGDKDWANSKRTGLDAVKDLEKEIEAALPGSFLPSSGCPGPEVIDLANNIRVIAINSQWWMHPYKKPGSIDNDCKCRTEQEFLDDLDELVQESEGKNILIIGHHPIVSHGNYGGRIPLKRHLFPFPDSYIPAPGLGSIYAAYRQNAGTPRDMAYPAYQRFISGMNKIFQKSSGLIYAAAHDYNLQLNQAGENYHIVSGSLSKKEPVGGDKETLFRKAATGFSKLEYFADGSIRIRFYRLSKGSVKELYSKWLFQSPCTSSPVAGIPVNNNSSLCPPQENPGSQTTDQYAVLPAGTIYKAGPLKRFFFGTLYRKTWSEPVKMPYLDLETSKGGLQPYGKGGGRQTLSLKFNAGNGKEYVFRSLDKDFTRTILPPSLKNTVFEPMLRDITATQHPYGTLAVSRMLDATDIPHAKPELYILPDDPKLGDFRKEFKNMPGILEDRPADPKPNTPGFMGADKVQQTTTMFSKLYKDHDNKIDAKMYGKARVFDMLIGDWGRHADNIKWAGFKKEKGMLYYPIPRDRDQGFSRWNGLFPSLADGYWVLPFIENFDERFHNLKSLNYNARYLDRALLASLDRKDWQELSNYITNKITESVIDSSINAFPAEVRNISGPPIAHRLKSRRGKLNKAVDEYYRLLARFVDVVGSNKNEYFEAERLKDGRVIVKMWESKNGLPQGDPTFERTFIPDETYEIRLYGLDGEDVFVVKGNTKKTIMVRIIGGEGDDKITDESVVHGIKRQTRVYDTSKTALTLGNSTKNFTSDKHDINQYSREDFKYNLFLPIFGVFYRSDDGFGVNAGYRYTTHGFRKQEYKAIHEMVLTGTTGKNLYLNLKSDWHHVVGKWDVIAQAGAGRYFPSFNFYGLGNGSKKIESLDKVNFYLLRTRGFTAGLLTERKFFKLASFSIGPVVEKIDIVSDRERTGEMPSFMAGPTLGGIQSVIDFDLRNKKRVASKGTRINAAYTAYYNFDRSNNFNVLESFLEYYGNVKLYFPIVLAAEIGGSKIYGSEVPLNKYAYLGQKNHLRGFVRHRFTGDASAYLNTEVRINLGKSENDFIPFYFGIFGFKDYGKAWYKGKTGNWHGSEGGGFYIAPISTRLTMRCSFEHSAEEKMLLDIGAGFYIDK